LNIDRGNGCGEYSRKVFEMALNHGGKGDEYVRFIVEELKPYIDETYQANRKTQQLEASPSGGSFQPMQPVNIQKYSRR